MAKIKKKINSNLLRISTTHGDTYTDTSRAEILTVIAHKLLDIEKIQIDIEELQAELIILDT